MAGHKEIIKKKKIRVLRKAPPKYDKKRWRQKDKKITACEMEMKVSRTPRRGWGERQDGLSRGRLTEVMRAEDERGEHDSGIQIQSRLTLFSFQRVLIQYPHMNKHTHTLSLSSVPLFSSSLSFFF